MRTRSPNGHGCALYRAYTGGTNRGTPLDWYPLVRLNSAGSFIRQQILVPLVVGHSPDSDPLPYALTPLSLRQYLRLPGLRLVRYHGRLQPRVSESGARYVLPLPLRSTAFRSGSRDVPGRQRGGLVYLRLPACGTTCPENHLDTTKTGSTRATQSPQNGPQRVLVRAIQNIR